MEIKEAGKKAEAATNGNGSHVDFSALRRQPPMHDLSGAVYRRLGLARRGSDLEMYVPRGSSNGHTPYLIEDGSDHQVWMVKPQFIRKDVPASIHPESLYGLLVPDLTRPIDGIVKSHAIIESGLAIIQTTAPEDKLVRMEYEPGHIRDLARTLLRTRRFAEEYLKGEEIQAALSRSLTALLKDAVAIGYGSRVLNLGRWISAAGVTENAEMSELKVMLLYGHTAHFKVERTPSALDPSGRIVDITDKVIKYTNRLLRRHNISNANVGIASQHTTHFVANEEPHMIGHRVAVAGMFVAPDDVYYMHDIKVGDGNGISHARTATEETCVFRKVRDDSLVLDGRLYSVDMDTLPRRPRDIVVSVVEKKVFDHVGLDLDARDVLRS